MKESRKTKGRVLCAAVLGLTLAGCAAAPGANIDLDRYGAPAYAEPNLSDKVNVQAITPGLISQLQQNTTVASPVANDDLSRQMQDYEYQIGPGDVLSVNVWEHPELSNPMVPAGLDLKSLSAPDSVIAGGSDSSSSSAKGGTGGGAGSGFLVASDGTIFYPYVGVVKVQGLTTIEIRKLLRERLTTYIQNPQLDVMVSSFHAKHIFVSGEVRSPGSLPISNVPLTLLDAINQSGGVLPTADWGDVLVTRAGHEYHFALSDLLQRGDMRQNILLQNNDVVFVPSREANKVFVLGEVTKQQTLQIGWTGMSLADALSQAGGLNQLTANATGIFVLRRSDAAASGKLIDVFQLDAKSAVAFVLADGFPLREHDIVYVTTAPLARWNKVVSLLLPSLDFLYLDVSARATLKQQ